jgi:alpha-galactosidase
LVIGNLRVDDPNYKKAMMSLSGNMPIMLGDTRVLSKETKRELKIWTNWMAEMEAKHGIMKFRQDLQGFGEPAWGSWDGFSRINTDTKSGGIVGVFRQDAVESSRLITVKNLEPNAIYQILTPDGKKFAKITGEKLGTEGFPVSSTEKIEGFLFEIKRVD